MQLVIGKIVRTALERFVGQFRVVFPRQRSLHIPGGLTTIPPTQYEMVEGY